MKAEPSDKLYGMPIWDLYICEICGSVLLKNTVEFHAKFHAETPKEVKQLPPRIKQCSVCGIELSIPVNADGSMELDDYDNHMESHGD